MTIGNIDLGFVNSLRKLTLGLGLGLFAFTVQAANECQFEYQYKNTNGSLQKKSQFVNAGAAVNVNQPNVRYVFSQGNNPVEIKIDNSAAVVGTATKLVGLNNVVKRDPPVGFYPNNIKLYQVKCMNSVAQFANPEQMIAALKNSVPVEQLIQQLKNTFNLTPEQIAQKLKSAGIQVEAIVEGLVQAGVMTLAETFRLKNIGIAIGDIVKTLHNKMGKTGLQIAQWARQNGIDANEIARALKDNVSSGSEIVQNWLNQAGYTSAQVAAAITTLWGQAAEVAQNPTLAGVKITCIYTDGLKCGSSRNTTPPVFSAAVRYSSNELNIYFEGTNLQGVNGVSGLPTKKVTVKATPFNVTLRTELLYSGSNWQGATSGIARLTTNGRAVDGGVFRWNFTPYREPTTRPPPQVNQAGPGGLSNGPTQGNSTTAPTPRADLTPVGLINHWSYNGQQELNDSRGGRFIYQKVDPKFCQVGMQQQNSQSTIGSGLLGVYHRKTFILPNTIGIEISNLGGTTAGTSTVQLKRGSQVVRSAAVSQIAPGQTQIVSVARPTNYNATKCVISGGGLQPGACFSCLQDVGEDGDLTVVVDSGNNIAESNENNNSQEFR